MEKQNNNNTKKHNKTFYSFHQNRPQIEASRLAEFLKEKNFMRISEEGNDAVTIIHNRRKILKPFNYKTNTISYLKKQIKHPEKRVEIENLLVAQRNTIESCWKLMDGESYNLHRDTHNAIYIPFKNGVCRVTKDETQMIDYTSDEIGFFIGTASQKHHFCTEGLSNRGIGDYERFLIYAIIGRQTNELTEDEMKKVISLNSIIGYLICNYKNPAFSPAIILSDENADDVARKGGRGKSLITEAIRKIRGALFRDGAKFESGYRHVYADLELFHDLYILDDVLPGFNFNALYTDITGDIRAEKKGTHAVTIRFQDAPKFVVTTNFAVRHDQNADSTNRRFIELKLSYFWNIDNTPEKYFGHRFFEDWDEQEWQLFYEYLVTCAKQFLTTGLIPTEYKKNNDNYNAYFSNEVVLEEFERIFGVMRIRGQFKVSDFLIEYNMNSLFRNDKFFHRFNTRNMVNAYIEKHNLPVKFEQRFRIWIFEEDETSSTSTNGKTIDDDNKDCINPFDS